MPVLPPLPQGSGSELQARLNAAQFQAVTGSSLSGSDVTLGGVLTVSSGQLLVSNGSASAPAVAPASDTNTGIYFDGSNDMIVSANGGRRFTFNATDCGFTDTGGSWWLHVKNASGLIATGNYTPTNHVDIRTSNSGDVPQLTVEQPTSANTFEINTFGGSGGDLFQFATDGLITHTATLDEATGDEVAHTLAYTTNKLTSGDDTGLLVSHTDTASPGESRMLDLQVGGVSRFYVRSSIVAEMHSDSTSGGLFVMRTSGNHSLSIPTFRHNKMGVVMNDGDIIGETEYYCRSNIGGSGHYYGNFKCVVDGTPGSTLTYDMPTAFVWEIAVDSGQNVPVERMRLNEHGLTASGKLIDATGDDVAFSLSYETDKATSGADTGLLVAKTDTNSPGTSYLIDAQTGGSTRFNVQDNGFTTITQGANGNAFTVQDSGLDDRFVVYADGGETHLYVYSHLGNLHGSIEYASNDFKIIHHQSLGNLEFHADDTQRMTIAANGGKATTLADLDDATGDEIAFAINPTINKATSGDAVALDINVTDTASPDDMFYLRIRDGGTEKAAFEKTSGGNLRLNIGDTSSGTDAHYLGRLHVDNNFLKFNNNSCYFVINSVRFGEESDDTAYINSNSSRAIEWDGTQLCTHTASMTQGTGDEVAHTINYTINKATSGDTYGLRMDVTDTASPGTDYWFDLAVGGTSKYTFRQDGAWDSATTADGYNFLIATSGKFSISNSRVTCFPSFRVDNGVIDTGGSNNIRFALGSKQVEFPDGAEATPTVTNDGDEDTGIWWPADNTIAISCEGTEAFRLATDGNHSTNSTLDAATGDEVGLTVNYTTNKATSGADTGILVEKTDTNSPGTSYLLDMKTDSIPVFRVGDAGNTKIDLNDENTVGLAIEAHASQVSDVFQVGSSSGNGDYFKVDNTGNGIFSGDLTCSYFYINEAASAASDTAGDGQIWVKNDTPNKMMFTDDAGNDFSISRMATATKTNADSPYTALASDKFIACDATSGAITVNLPAASSSTGLVYHIKKIDSAANNITIDGNGSETIDGATTQTLSTQYSSLHIVCDGTEWWII